MAAHTGHAAETPWGAAHLRSHASARRARHRLTRTQPATAPARLQHQPQPHHGKEDMWSPQSDFSDDSTLSQTQNVRPMKRLAPTPHTSPHFPAPPATRARATGHSVTPRLAPPHSGAPWPSPARSS
eukprot:scaffold84760_cov78-Phaeocystis_antarctica.AAC.1